MMNYARYLFLAGVLVFVLVALASHSAHSAFGQEIEVTLLGTGDPVPRVDRFGPSTLMEAGEQMLLFDAGRGAMQRIFQLGVSTADLDAIFLTHLHSDHLIGLVDLWLTGWVINGRDEPIRIYGPPGIRSLVGHLIQAFAFDIAIRTSEARRSPEGVRIDVVEIADGFEWQADGVVVRAFAVDHGPVTPAFGYRLDFGGRSVVLSGDTRYSESLIRSSEGVDLLIHEVVEAPEDFKARNPNLPRLAHHTQAADAGRVFKAVSPKLAVYSHLVLVDGFEAADLIPLTRKTYEGRVLVGEDLMTIIVGDSVVVRTMPQAVRQQDVPEVR